MYLSIIIPVYKVEQYLDRCVQSIFTQDYSKSEVILVDDGSPDRCGEMCDEYALKYKNVKVIHKKNGGLSSARNTGIDNAQGKYIMFLDSDDWIAEGCLSKFFDIINNNDVDIIIGKSKTIDDAGHLNDKIKYFMKKGSYTIEEYLSILKKKRNYIACAPFILYRRTFLEEKNLRFMEGVLHEDELWTPSVLINANSVYYSDIYFYYNYIRQGSISHSNNKEREGRNLLIVSQELLKLFNSCKRDDIQALRDKMVFNYFRAICLVSDFSQERKIFTPSLLKRNAYFKSTKLKAFLYGISPRLYLWVHKVVKG